MSTRNIIIENLDTLAYGVLDPRTVNHLQAYDCMRQDLDMELDNRLIDLLAVIVHLGDMGEELVSVKQLKATHVNPGALPVDIDDGLGQLKQAGFICMIDIIDDGDGDIGVLLTNRFPCE